MTRTLHGLAVIGFAAGAFLASGVVAHVFAVAFGVAVARWVR